MAITIDYSDTVTPQYVINVPRADMLLVSSSPTEIRQLNINDFRLQLNDLMDDEIGMAFPTNHVHTAPLTISGVTLSRSVEILPPYAIEFEDGLYNVNIVGGNSNISDVTIKNQVGVNTANSAGLQDPFAFQAAAFGDGVVAVAQTSGQSGTTFPRGTRSFPVNNFADAEAIAVQRGIKTFLLVEDTTIGAQDFSAGFSFRGDNPNTLCTIEPAANVTNCEFKNLTVQGTLDGGNILRECALLDINYFNGFIYRCGMAGTVTLAGPSTATFLSCYSLVAGGGAEQVARINMGGVHVTPLVVRDYQGGLRIQNLTDDTADAGVSIDMSSGRVQLEASMTAGNLTLRGIGDLEDNSGPGCTVNNLLINRTSITEEVWAHSITDHTADGTFGALALAAAAQGLQHCIDDNFVYGGPAGQPTAFRRRVFLNEAALDAAAAGAPDGADGEIARFEGAATYTGTGPADTLSAMRLKRVL